MFGKVIIKDEMSKEILSSMNLPIACCMCSAVAHLLKLGWSLFTKITGNKVQLARVQLAPAYC